MIDLHAHTNASDGTHSPEQLVREAQAAGLSALGVCDHDTFAGADEAVDHGAAAGLEIIRGIELSTRLPMPGSRHGKSVHILGYFLHGNTTDGFRSWLRRLQASRRERNERLAERLRRLSLRVTVEQAEALGGSITGRPHFARLLVSKGYAANQEEAFRLYLGESGKAYVDRWEPEPAEAVRQVLEAGGTPALAHPARLSTRNGDEEEGLLRDLAAAGLAAIEAYHSDHSPEDIRRYRRLAERHGWLVTGGSDFHGEAKPRIKLGCGRGDLSIPGEILHRLREFKRAPSR